MKVTFRKAPVADPYPDLEVLEALLRAAPENELRDHALSAIAYVRQLEAGLLALATGAFRTPEELDARLAALEALLSERQRLSPAGRCIPETSSHDAHLQEENH
jgi:hypothetical protein